MDKIEQALREIERDIDMNDAALSDLLRDRASMPARIYKREYADLSARGRELRALKEYLTRGEVIRP